MQIHEGIGTEVSTGYEAEFFFVQSEPFVAARIPFAVLLGVFCGLVSLYFTRSMNMMENIFSRLSAPWKKILLGGSILAMLIFIFPPLYGEGYTSIIQLLSGNISSIVDGSLFYGEGSNVWFLLAFIACLILAKSFATSATNGGGGVGGTFAPSLYVGCMESPRSRQRGPLPRPRFQVKDIQQLPPRTPPLLRRLTHRPQGLRFPRFPPPRQENMENGAGVYKRVRPR